MKKYKKQKQKSEDSSDFGLYLHLGLIGVVIVLIFFVLPELIKYCWMHRHEIMDYIMSLFYNSHY